MKKVYVLSKRKDAELEQAIYDMDAYFLRIALYGIARGRQFDDAFSTAEEASQHSVRRIGGNAAAFCEEHQFRYIGERCPLCPPANR